MTRPREQSYIRIIGGDWRSRRLPVLANSGVRPTSDRTRETLFNWLQGYIAGANCLDLFAGSGALGFEALSRGAGKVTLVDEDLRVVQQLQQNTQSLETPDAKIIWQEAEQYLCQSPTTGRHLYDIVFLDPPFRDDQLVERCYGLLQQGGWLSDAALIYMESDRHRPFPQPLPGWEVMRDKQSGQVAYRLLRRTIEG